MMTGKELKMVACRTWYHHVTLTNKWCAKHRKPPTKQQMLRVNKWERRALEAANREAANREAANREAANLELSNQYQLDQMETQ